LVTVLKEMMCSLTDAIMSSINMSPKRTHPILNAGRHLSVETWSFVRHWWAQAKNSYLLTLSCGYSMQITTKEGTPLSSLYLFIIWACTSFAFVGGLTQALSNDSWDNTL
jgi:hypothetical protein